MRTTRVREKRYAFGVRIVLVEGKERKWDAARRMRVALANNNRGHWFVALSRRTVADIERRFVEESVAGLLWGTVGGVLGDHRKLRQEEGKHYLYIQLDRWDGDVALCLEELGVFVLEPIAFSQIRHY